MRRLVRAHLLTEEEEEEEEKDAGVFLTAGGGRVTVTEEREEGLLWANDKVFFPCMSDITPDDDDDGCSVSLYLLDDAVLGVEPEDLVVAPTSSSSSSSSIEFPGRLELPRLTEEVSRLMEEEMGAAAFADAWRTVARDEGTVETDTGWRTEHTPDLISHTCLN